jgi:DNA-binding transcriptional LysR family regulator
VLPLAETVERTTQAIARGTSALDQRVEGVVRVTTSEAFSGFFVKRFGELRARHPGLMIEVLSGTQAFDLARGEADIAVRIMKTTQRELIVRKLVRAGWSLYAATGYIERRGVPDPVEDLRGHDIVGFDESMARVPGAEWLEKHGAGANLAMRGNSLIAVLNATLAGMGIGAVPCFLADDEPTLRRLTPKLVGTREVTLVVHPDMAKVARVRAVIDFIVEVAQREQARLRGAS